MKTIAIAMQEILPTLREAKKFGFRKLDNGTQLIGRTPHIAPEAWFHRIFAPLSETDVSQLEKNLERTTPDSYKDFLTVFANGLGIFSGSLDLYGFRKNYVRTGDQVWQPFALERPNLYERLLDASVSYFFIGGYQDDGSLLYLKSSHVYRCSDKSAKPLNHWESLGDMLVSEVTRLNTLFDEIGRLRNPGVPTSP